MSKIELNGVRIEAEGDIEVRKDGDTYVVKVASQGQQTGWVWPWSIYPNYLYPYPYPYPYGPYAPYSPYWPSIEPAPSPLPQTWVGPTTGSCTSSPDLVAAVTYTDGEGYKRSGNYWGTVMGDHAAC